MINYTFPTNDTLIIKSTVSTLRVKRLCQRKIVHIPNFFIGFQFGKILLADYITILIP
jgi:hypothetical protein